MKKEFNLSEKINGERIQCIYVEDIKEFIKRRDKLDKLLKLKLITWAEHDKRVDKLAGDKLI